jgi:hypothetical protein
MRINTLKAIIKTAARGAAVLLVGSAIARAQVSVSLTAAPTSTTLPDGLTVQMWGYSCGTATPSTACARLSPNASGWSPVVITVTTGQTLQINLTNSLTFGANRIPTSLTIVGQLGGGLGTSATSSASPMHDAQTLTWPASSTSLADGANTPPPQVGRVRSFATEVDAGGTTTLNWTALREGTYLLESGTHPSIQGPMGLYGMVVVTGAGSPGTAYAASPAVNYDADVRLLFSEIDPVQNNAVAIAVGKTGFSEAKVWSGLPGKCGNPTSGAEYQTCYPPAVNYAPRYYLINGVAFDKTNAANSLFPHSPAPLDSPAGKTALVRMVNAGLRMHVPSIVGAQTGSSAAAGFSLIAEDGNVLPGVRRTQSEVFMAPGKTYDVMVNVPVAVAPATAPAALPIYDRALGLSGNGIGRDTGMLAYLSINGGTIPSLPTVTAKANTDSYPSLVAGKTLTVSDPAQGVLRNDVNIYGVRVVDAVAGLKLNVDGTFTYDGGPTTFTYCGNGAAAGDQDKCATVNLSNAALEAASGITCTVGTWQSNVATTLSIKPPGVLANCKDAAGYPLNVAASPAPTLTVGNTTTGSVSVDSTGAFTATVPGAGSYTLNFTPQNSQGTSMPTPQGAPAAATAILVFPAANGPHVTLVNNKNVALSSQDYRWIIEEDRTFYVDPACQTNPLPAECPVVTAQGAPAVFGTNFHTSYMPIVAQGCVGTTSCEDGQKLLGAPAACDIGNGACRTGGGISQKESLDPSQVHLDPAKHYYISVLPGDAMSNDDEANPGHAMGGAQIAPGQTVVNVVVEPQLQPAAKLSAFVFEDDHPLNGEHDASGGVDVLAPNEAGLGGFNITIMDLVGMSGDSAGQMTYDEFGQPLSNSLAGTIDPATNQDACPIVNDSYSGSDGTSGITGMIPVCPKYEADGSTLSPLAGQAVVANMPPGRYGIIATPAADRISRGEEWLQTNTLDGGKDHEAFIKAGEPAYFQEFGPASFHVSIGFANPQHINDHGTNTSGTGFCDATPAGGGQTCNATVKGQVTGSRMSRPSDERLYGSGSRDTFGYTQCYASLGTPDGGDFSFAKCDEDGKFTLNHIPAGDWRLTIFDQWNDQIVDGISTPVRVGVSTNATLCHGPDTSSTTCDMGEIAVHAWKNNLSTLTFFDMNGDGIPQNNEQGLSLVPTNVRYRDGSISNLNSTDLEGSAGFNEVFPIFNWYVVETDSNRYKNTGTHVINDAGGPADTTNSCGTNGFPACGSSGLMANLSNTNEKFSLPAELRIPGAVYCANADCTGTSIKTGPIAGGSSGPTTNISTGRIDPPWVNSYGWQTFMGQNQLLEFGKKPFASGENGGIHGHVVYASTRPFDDPALLLQLTWEPQVPNVIINLYQEDLGADGVTKILHKVDTTQTSSWDDWAQGFRKNADGSFVTVVDSTTGLTSYVPNMNCPGQDPGDTFLYTMTNQPNYLDWYNSQHGGPAAKALASSAQFKCYDGMHNWNQLQPAPYDGAYNFPSVTGINPTSGKAAGTNCHMNTTSEPWGCIPNPDGTDPYRSGAPMLPAGKYVVEMVVPPGYELVKEEDKNILLGDTYDAPVTSQFAGFGNIFILPDQASVAAYYNANNSLNETTDLGVQPRHEGDTGSVETFWPCVGALRVVPDFNSLYPEAGQNAPFAGATRPLCDRKEVVLQDQMSVLAKFYVFTSTHIAAHFTGIISDDFTGEFDPFSPAFGEKFSPANLPVGIRDFSGTEVARVYSDNFGIYNGLTYSSFSVNPPDPSGYIPQMMVMCMNDRGSGATPDSFYQEAYSQYCYEWSFMPGQTSYLDTPVIPTSAFAPNYNHPDCAYPNATPAIKQVDGDGVGPWVAGTGTAHPITITALGDQPVSSYAYSGPKATSAPWNQKTISRHYGFGASQGTGSVTVGGVTANVTSWADDKIVINLPTASTSQVPLCSLQQQSLYGGTSARCGELIITAGNGKKSVDTVTITIENKAPARVAAGQKIQDAIDRAKPGDLIMVGPGVYHEQLIMWKPVRLQGTGAASSIIDANAHPSDVLAGWRKRVNCLFGLGENGSPKTWNATCNGTWAGHVGFNASANHPQADRIPSEATLGWDASLNGNLAEQLQEPSLMGAYEGAGITVLAKGVDFHNADPFTDTLAGAFPDGTTLLALANCGSSTNPFPSSFSCNPSRIDGLSIANSSQGGGGIFVHAWAHNLEIANNRVKNNQGTLAGGITVGQGEFPPQQIQGAAALLAPGSCSSTLVPGSRFTGSQLPYCHNLNVNVHHNAVTTNASEGDELFSASASGAGGVAFCSGADNYKFNFNWICGNLSTGDGSGVSHMGFSWNGQMQHNTIIFNQATNPTTPSNGGGLLIGNSPDTDPNCPAGSEADADCSLAFSTAPGDGVGPNLLINANLIMGNAAEAGSGGGIRFQGVNGTEVGTFPSNPERWYTVTVTNNIIADNVAGWDGGGISLQDSIGVNLINNTIISNDSTASSGTLFGAFFAPEASSPTPCLRDSSGASTRCTVLSTPQPAGLSSGRHSAEFLASLPTSITCPVGHGLGGTTNGGRTNGACRTVSFPILYNDIFWQNRAFNIVVATPTSGTQQSTVTLMPALNQTDTGQCVTPASYWDIGLRGDTGPTNHNSLFTFTPQSSVLTNITGYPGGGTGFKANTASFSPGVVRQYCNGSKIPPENTDAASVWYQVPPGTFEGNVPTPVFNMTAGATVDEGNNWISISWGPLSLIAPSTETNPSSETMLGNYSLASGSPAIGYISPSNSATTYTAAPLDDFFGSLRKTDGAVDAGAVEFAGGGTATASAAVTPSPLAFGNQGYGTTSPARTLTVTNTGNVALAGGTFTFGAGPFSRATILQGGPGTCGATLAIGASCTINVVFAPPASSLTTPTNYSSTLAVAYTGATVIGSPVNLTGTGTPTGTLSFTAATNGTLTGAGLTRLLTFTIPSPRAPVTSVVTVTNTGGGPLQITAENLLLNPSTSYSITGNTCSFTTPLAPNGTCTISIRYATPATQPLLPRIGSMTVANNGTGTILGVTTLGLSAR